MCATCGCSEHVESRITAVGDAHGGHEHDHLHAHDHEHDHPHPHAHRHAEVSPSDEGRRIRLEQDVLAKNHVLAERNRGWLEARKTVAWNLMSSPGAGKTTLLERTIRDLRGEIDIAVVEGDQETTRDADRIHAAGAAVVQVNTGTGCHLDAAMVGEALRRLDPRPGFLVLIENVGNLVCPALFDLGEAERVVIVSVTEGEDKPLKYPHMFRAADLLLLNKIDLLPHLEFDVGRFAEHARRVKPDLRMLEVSAVRGDGLDEWYDGLRRAAASSVSA